MSNTVKNERILVTGACGRLGAAIVSALKRVHGDRQVIVSDIAGSDAPDQGSSSFTHLSVLDKSEMHSLVIREKVTQVYHLAAQLTTKGEKQPRQTWDLNMQGLINVLDIAKCENIRVFWPSSIAVFGGNSPRAQCPQFAVTEPATVYGISKVAGELWCKYYHDHYGVDVRSIRYPGIVSHESFPRGGTTDYAAEIFHEALAKRHYTCYLKPHTTLPLIYMPDAIRAALYLMAAPAAGIKIWSSYNIAALSCAPAEFEAAIRSRLPAFRVEYKPDFRQQIAESWPISIDDRFARRDWGWSPAYDLDKMTADMIRQLEFNKAQKT